MVSKKKNEEAALLLNILDVTFRSSLLGTPSTYCRDAITTPALSVSSSSSFGVIFRKMKMSLLSQLAFDLQRSHPTCSAPC